MLKLVTREVFTIKRTTVLSLLLSMLCLAYCWESFDLFVLKLTQSYQ